MLHYSMFFSALPPVDKKTHNSHIAQQTTNNVMKLVQTVRNICFFACIV